MSNDALPEVNAQKTLMLTAELLGAVRNHYLGNTISRERVFEVLNALAATAGKVIEGAGNDSYRVRAWFLEALDRNIRNPAAMAADDGA